MKSFSLKNHTAIITGGSRGYGAGIAEALANRGAEVWITGRDEAQLREVAQRIGATPFVGDVTDGESWDQLFEKIQEKTGRLDILVNNAGSGINIGPVAEQSDDDVRDSIGVNLTGAILGCRRAANVMIPQGSGLIINIGSVCAKHAWGEWSIYSAAKAGLLQFSKCFLTEMRPHGVRVTSVIPSWGQTEFTDACGLPSRGKDILEKCIAPIELGELVAQIAEQPAHLLTEEVTLWPMVQPIGQL